MFFLILLDADCSGRILATILVAWVSTAMIASILLQWEHMWIVLVILTLLFFLVCGYTVYTVKRTHARILIEQQRATIRTISDITANCRQQTRPFTLRSAPDLPPSYASVVTIQGTSASVRPPEIIDSLAENKFEDPPPYSIVIASTNTQGQNTEVLNEQQTPPVVFTKKEDVVISGLASVSHTSPHPT